MHCTLYPTSLPLSDIHRDGGTQLRVQPDRLVIAEYAAALAAGATFPPVVVFHDGETFWLADGHHRVAAAEEAGLTRFPVEVRPGTRRDATLFAAGANVAHGLRRSNADKRHSVETLLRDPEWGGWSDREIGRRCGVHHDLVGEVRKALSGGFRHMERRVRRGETSYIQRRSAGATGPRTLPIEPTASPSSEPAGTEADRAASSVPRAGLRSNPARFREAEQILASPFPIRSVRPDEWWRLGEQRLFTGTRPEPAVGARLGPFRLVFVELKTEPLESPWPETPVLQEWLRSATVLTVLTPPSDLPRAFIALPLPYLRTIACVRDTDAVPRAGSPGWSPVVISGSLPELALPEVLRVSRLTGPTGSRLTLELAVLLLESLTFPGDAVLACGPAGDVALLAAELTGRRCVVVEGDLSRVAGALARWEVLTEKKAEIEPLGRL